MVGWFVFVDVNECAQGPGCKWKDVYYEKVREELAGELMRKGPRECETD